MGSLADGGCKLDMDEELEGAAVSAGWGGTLPVPISPHNQGALHTNLRRLRHENTIVAAKSHLKSVLKAPDSLAPLPTCGIHCTSMRAYIQLIHMPDQTRPWVGLKRKKGVQYDVFLSYAVGTESKLVNDIYWQLSGQEVMSNGKKRKLRIFWDRECLKTGEDWENAFGSALCNCSLVVMFISRALLLRLKGLTSASLCDNVLLEHQMAVSLKEMGKAQILPIFVGNRDPDPSKDGFDLFSDMNPDVIGLMWRCAGVSEPTEGRLLTNQALARSLTTQTEFTKAELAAFAISDLREDDYIKSGDSFFTPDSKMQSGWKIINSLPATYVDSVSEACQKHLRANASDENGGLSASRSVLNTYQEIKGVQGIFVSGPSYEGTHLLDSVTRHMSTYRERARNPSDEQALI